MLSMQWVPEIAAQVASAVRAFGTGVYDPNMRTAFAVALVMAYWYARVHHAKISDPARPLQLRREVWYSWLASAQVMQSIWLDERFDAAIMPGQKWNNPWWPGARGGKFV